MAQLAWSTLSAIAVWMTRGLMLSPVPGCSTPIFLGVRMAAGQINPQLAGLSLETKNGLTCPVVCQNIQDLCLLVIHTSRLMLESGSSRALFFLLPLVGAHCGPLPASVYLSVKYSSAWERTVISELAWTQCFLPPLSQPPLA